MGGRIYENETREDSRNTRSAVGKRNCRSTLIMCVRRVVRLKQRAEKLGMSPEDSLIVLACADDVYGGPLAEALMPGTNWQGFRDQGMTPFVCGVVAKNDLRESISIVDDDAATKLRQMSGLAIVVVDHGVIEVFSA